MEEICFKWRNSLWSEMQRSCYGMDFVALFYDVNLDKKGWAECWQDARNESMFGEKFRLLCAVELELLP